MSFEKLMPVNKSVKKASFTTLAKFYSDSYSLRCSFKNVAAIIR